VIRPAKDESVICERGDLIFERSSTLTAPPLLARRCWRPGRGRQHRTALKEPSLTSADVSGRSLFCRPIPSLHSGAVITPKRLGWGIEPAAGWPDSRAVAAAPARAPGHRSHRVAGLGAIGPEPEAWRLFMQPWPASSGFRCAGSGLINTLYARPARGARPPGVQSLQGQAGPAMAGGVSGLVPGSISGGRRRRTEHLAPGLESLTRWQRHGDPASPGPDFTAAAKRCFKAKPPGPLRLVGSPRRTNGHHGPRPVPPTEYRGLGGVAEPGATRLPPPLSWPLGTWAGAGSCHGRAGLRRAGQSDRSPELGKAAQTNSQQA